MKKKFISMAVAFAAVTISANAQSYIMQIHKTDGSTVTVDADDVEKVTFAEKPYEFETVPTGTDRTTGFTEDADVLSKNKEVNIPLAADGQYTMSGSIDFVGTQVSLYTIDAASPATVTMTADASFVPANGFVLKYINFDCSASAKPFITMSSTPDEASKGATGSGDYYNIMQPITINGCEISNLRSSLYTDNGVKYCAGTFLVTNSIVHFNIDGSGTIDEDALINAYAGHINNFTAQNSTMYNTGSATPKYVVRYNNSGRADRAGYLSDYVNFRNCTFFHLNNDQFCNYDGLAGRASSNFTVTNNIFVDCGAIIARRIVGGRVGSASATFSNNTYMNADGSFQSTNGSCAGYDDSGTAIEADPGFKDAANGDFTVSGEQQIAKRTGDPRWLPEAE